MESRADPPRPKPTLDDARAVLLEFGRAGAAVRPMSGGFANWSFQVGADPGEVLTFCANKRDDAVRALIAALRALAAAGVETSRLRPTTAGAPHARWRGVPVLLKTFVAGRVIEVADVESARAAGRALGALGDVAPPPEVPRGHPYGLGAFDTLPEAGRVGVGAWLMARRDALLAARPAEGAAGLVHGDAFPDNMVVDGGVVRLIDFEEACRDRLMLDLGMACVGFMAFLAAPDAVLRALVSAYAQRQPRVVDELAHLPHYVEVAATMTAFWRHRERVRTGGRTRAADPAAMVAVAESARARDWSLIAGSAR